MHEPVFYVRPSLQGSNLLYRLYGRFEKRIATHNAGKGAKYTRVRTPVTLLYAKEFATKQEAMKAEAAFKKFSRPKKETFLQTIGATVDRPVIIYLEGEQPHETTELSD